MSSDIVQPDSFTADELENSFPLAEARRFAHPRGRELVEHVMDGMDRRWPRQRARKADADSKARATVEALLANLVAGHLNAVDPDRFVAVSFSKASYNGSALSLTAMRACRDHLEAEGLITVAPGFTRPDEFGDGRFGRRTRLRAPEKLRAQIDDADLGKRPLSMPSDQLIRIKKKAEDVGLPPAHVEASRKLISGVNLRLARTELGLRPEAVEGLRAPLPDDGSEDAEDRARKRRYAGDLTATSIYRAFTRDWRSGGRFYGGWWMSIPKALRPYITIDGEPVVELDYRFLHPLLLFRRENLDLNFDPYTVPPWMGKDMRNLGKRTFNRLLNYKANDPARRLNIRAANGDNDILPAKVSFSTFRNSLVAQLNGIAHWFGTKEGVHLQYEDSELALSVMQQMEDEAIPVLPVHDSFLVAEHYEETLRLAMLDVFVSKYGDVPWIERSGPAPTV